jgi:hypothetical protein
MCISFGPGGPLPNVLSPFPPHDTTPPAAPAATPATQAPADKPIVLIGASVGGGGLLVDPLGNPIQLPTKA